MVTICLLLSLLGEKLDPDWVSYKPLTSLQVTQIDGVGYFVSDYDEHQVRHYDEDWKLVRLLGGPGEGPGKLSEPMNLFNSNGLLYVRDRTRIHAFDSGGRFQKAFRIPILTAFKHIHIVTDGWVVVQTNYQQTRVALEHYDREFKNPVLIKEWFSEAYTAANPFPGNTFTSQTRDGRSILIKPEQQDTIWVYDTENRTLRTFEIALRPRPVSDEKKKEIASAHNQGRPHDRYQRVTANDVPDHYPLFSRIFPTITGKFKLSLRFDEIDMPDGFRKYHEAGLHLYVDLAGDRLEPEIADFVPEMVIDRDDRFIYHTGYDPEDESFSLYRTPKAAFLETAYQMQQAFSQNACLTCK